MYEKQISFLFGEFSSDCSYFCVLLLLFVSFFLWFLLLLVFIVVIFCYVSFIVSEVKLFVRYTLWVFFQLYELIAYKLQLVDEHITILCIFILSQINFCLNQVTPSFWLCLCANSRLCCMHFSYHWCKIPNVSHWLMQISKTVKGSVTPECWRAANNVKHSKFL